MEELEKDLVASLAGMAVTEAFGAPKKLAAAAGVDESNGRRWARGERANPVYRFLALIDRARDPWALVTAAAMRAARAALKAEGPLPEWRWRQLYLEAFRVEQQIDGQEDVVSVGILTGNASVADLVAADGKVLAATMRRYVLGFIGQQMGWSLRGPRP